MCGMLVIPGFPSVSHARFLGVPPSLGSFWNVLLLRYAMDRASLRNCRKNWASQARGRCCVSVHFPRGPPHQTKLTSEILAWHLLPRVLKAGVLWLWSLLAHLYQHMFQMMQVPSL